MMSFFIHSALAGSLFYYVGKGFLPTVITGKTVYALIIAVTALAFVAKACITRKLISENMNLATLLFGAVSVLLFLALLLSDDVHRFQVSMTMYFGIFFFVLMFYGLFALFPVDLPRIVKMFLVILTLEAFAEFILINFAGVKTTFLVHYDEDFGRDMLGTVEAGSRAAITGLLGNRTNTAVFMVALLWFHNAFRKPRAWLADPATYLFAMGFLSCLSGTAFVVFLISFLLYRARNMAWFLVLMIPGLLFLERWLVSNSSAYLHKISYGYLGFVLNYKLSQFTDLLEILYQHPRFLLYGVPASFNLLVSSDISLLKAISDFGIAPLVLYACLMAGLVKNLKSAGLPPRSLHSAKLALLSLALGTLHYPVLFSFPVQALLGALIAYSMHLRTKPSLNALGAPVTV